MNERVESMAEQENQPMMNRGMPYFEWNHGIEIEDFSEIEDERELIIVNGDVHEAMNEQSS